MMLEDLKEQKKLIVGTKQVLKAVKDGKVATLFIAKDAERRVTRTVEDLAKEQQIQIVYVDSMKKLGKACEINVGAASAAILK
ncbi:MAG TPA: 50S ribosomal protein L7ae-like protein [Clostridiales bacterium]|nr:50S ribosomal protein L7ae-like protein [Clostridiales bacterium]